MSDSIQADVLCTSCGYNLHGLDTAANCPECGLTTSDSRRGGQLHFADHAWLRVLLRGASLKLWSLLIAIIGGVGLGLTTGVFRLPPSSLLLNVLVGVLGLMATFCITAQEPRLALSEDPLNLRKLVRVCALVVFVGLLSGHLSEIPISSSPLPSIFLIPIGVIATIGWLVIIFGELAYLRRFALRESDQQLATSTRNIMWSFGVTMVLVIISAVALTVFSNGAQFSLGNSELSATYSGSLRNNQPRILPVAAGVCLFGLVLFWLLIWYVALFIRYQSLFKQAIARKKIAGIGIVGGNATHQTKISDEQSPPGSRIS